jgi:hypothetical protein
MEAMLCRVPCVRLMRHPPIMTSISLLPYLCIAHPDESDDVMRLALSPDYIMLQDKWMQEREELIFHRLDGLAAGRIADVCIEAIKNNDLVDPFQPFVYPQKFEPEKIWHPNAVLHAKKHV